MNFNKLLLVAGVVGLMGAAAPAQAGKCWWKCTPSSSGGTPSSSGGDPTPVPEPEQMALFGMGAAVLVGRVFFARRKQK